MSLPTQKIHPPPHKCTKWLGQCYHILYVWAPGAVRIPTHQAPSHFIWLQICLIPSSLKQQDKRKPLESVIYKANLPSRNVHLQKTVGLHHYHFYFLREKRETHPFPHTFQLYCLQTFGKRFEAKANHFASRGSFPGAGGTCVTEEGTQQSGKPRLWLKAFLGKGCTKTQSVPLGSLIRIPGVQGHVLLWNPWNEQMNRTIPKRACAKMYLNHMISLEITTQKELVTTS